MLLITDVYLNYPINFSIASLAPLFVLFLSVALPAQIAVLAGHKYNAAGLVLAIDACI